MSRLKKSQRAAEDVLGDGKRSLRSNAEEQTKLKQIEASDTARRGSGGGQHEGGEGAPPGAKRSKEIRRRSGDRGTDQAKDDRAMQDPASGEDDHGTELDFGHVGIAR
jgi:hypothetical protein